MGDGEEPRGIEERDELSGFMERTVSQYRPAGYNT